MTGSSSSSSGSPGQPGSPPHSGTVFLDPDIIRPGDPSLFDAIRYVGAAQRSAWHSERAGVQTFNAHLFELSFSDGDTLEVAVEAVVGSQSQARTEADKLAIPLGQIPAILRKHMSSLVIFAGTGRGSASGGKVSTYAADNDIKIRDGFLEEFLTHEATHTSLDAIYYANDAYRQAVQNDNNFISTYARDNASSEDLAETVVPYLAVRLRPDRISADWDARIRAAMAHRIAFLDNENLDWHPVHDTADSVRGKLNAPTPGTRLHDTSASFNWAAPETADLFELLLGTTGPGSTDVYQDTTTNSFATVDRLPDDGRPVFARLRTRIDNQWRYDDYTYLGYDSTQTAATLLSPLTGAFLKGTELDLRWDHPAGASAFDLLVGDQGAGSHNLRASQITDATHAQITDLPLHGQTLYLRLFTKNDSWLYRDYTVIAASNASRADLIAPVPGTGFSEATVTFRWNSPIGARHYDLLVGTTGPGATDIRASNVTGANSVTLTNIPTDGRAVYVRLWTNVDDWEYQDYVF